MAIPAIILAAGLGTRMGTPKALLSVNDVTLWEYSYRKLDNAGYHPIISIINQEIKVRCSWQAREHTVINPFPEAGPLYSIYLGVQLVQNMLPCLLYPIDFPLVRLQTLRSLLEQAARFPQSVILPTYEGKKGHPIIIPSSLFPKLNGKDYSGGLAAIIRESNTDKLLLPVPDRGILSNINQLTDWQACKGEIR